MITKEIALELRVGQELWHNYAKNADGSPKRCRVSGACQTWKRGANDRFRIPVKLGLKGHGEIVQYPSDAKHHSIVWEGLYWSLPDRWAIERHWR